MKHLPKHIRPRWRYLAVELETWPDARVTRRGFQRAVWFAAQNLLGDPGSADADLRLLAFDFDRGDGEAVVRVRRDEVESARAALACVSEVDGCPVRVRVRGVSGTVRACEEKYIRGPAIESGENRVVYRSASRRSVGRDGRIDVELDDGFAGATRLDIH